MSRKPRDLTQEEKLLWEQITRKIKPISADKKHVPLKPLRTLLKVQKKPNFVPIPEEPFLSKSHNDISHRIPRVKKVPIEARLDLHGFTLDQARMKLSKFLISCQQKHYLWVLIITGKGQLAQDSAKKTLRNQVPLWLEEPHLKSVVSAYATAKPQDGGGGAIYVRLKRDKHSK